MTFDEFWKHYVGGDKDKSLETGRIYAASAWDYQQARIEALKIAARDVVERHKRIFTRDHEHYGPQKFVDYASDEVRALATLLEGGE